MSISFERSSFFRPADLGLATKPSPKLKPAEDAGFGDRLGDAFKKVESATKEADVAADDLVAGKIDIHQAMVSMEKANLMLQLGTGVRDKLMDAYQKLLTSGN